MDKSKLERSQSLVRIGGPVDRMTVSLRLFGDDLDPDEISRLLNCDPSVGQIKGEEITSSVTGRKRIVRTGSWRLESDTDEDVDLEEQINRLLSRVSGDILVWESLTKRYKADLFCGLFLEEENRGFNLSAAILQKITERKLSVGFDIYATFDDEGNEEAL